MKGYESSPIYSRTLNEENGGTVTGPRARCCTRSQEYRGGVWCELRHVPPFILRPVGEPRSSSVDSSRSLTDDNQELIKENDADEYSWNTMFQGYNSYFHLANICCCGVLYKRVEKEHGLTYCLKNCKGHRPRPKCIEYVRGLYFSLRWLHSIGLQCRS